MNLFPTLVPNRPLYLRALPIHRRLPLGLLLAGFLGVTSLCVLVGAASAAPVTYRVEGTVIGTLEAVGGDVTIPAGIQLDAPISVTWTFDATGVSGARHPQLLGLDIMLGDVLLSTSNYDIEIDNDSFVAAGSNITGPFDVYGVRACAGGSSPCSSPGAPGLLWTAGLQLLDNTGEAFDNRILGSSPHELNEILSRTLTVSFTSPTGPGLSSVLGEFGSITVIPEPSTALLFGMGLAALRCSRRSA